MANTKQTSKSVASKASKILRDGRYSKTSKSVAGSALYTGFQNKHLRFKKSKMHIEVNMWKQSKNGSS